MGKVTHKEKQARCQLGEVGRSISSYGKDRGRCVDEAAESRALSCTRTVWSNEVEQVQSRALILVHVAERGLGLRKRNSKQEVLAKAGRGFLHCVHRDPWPLRLRIMSPGSDQSACMGPRSHVLVHVFPSRLFLSLAMAEKGLYLLAWLRDL